MARDARIVQAKYLRNQYRNQPRMPTGPIASFQSLNGLTPSMQAVYVISLLVFTAEMVKSQQLAQNTTTVALVRGNNTRSPEFSAYTTAMIYAELQAAQEVNKPDMFELSLNNDAKYKVRDFEDQFSSKTALQNAENFIRDNFKVFKDKETSNGFYKSLIKILTNPKPVELKCEKDVFAEILHWIVWNKVSKNPFPGAQKLIDLMRHVREEGDDEYVMLEDFSTIETKATLDEFYDFDTIKFLNKEGCRDIQLKNLIQFLSTQHNTNNDPKEAVLTLQESFNLRPSIVLIPKLLDIYQNNIHKLEGSAKEFIETLGLEYIKAIYHKDNFSITDIALESSYELRKETYGMCKALIEQLYPDDLLKQERLIRPFEVLVSYRRAMIISGKLTTVIPVEKEKVEVEIEVEISGPRRLAM